MNLPSEHANDGRHRLLRILSEQAVITGDGIRLASGRTSAIYFNVKRPMFDPEGSSLIADEMLARLARLEVDAVGGMAMGAVPIVAAVCAKSFPGHPLPGFFVRKDVKDYGTQRRIEGCFESGMRTVLLEDVTTTGGSTLQAAAAVREAGGTVATAITVVDRLEGAREAMAADGIELLSLFTRDDFVA